LRIVLHFSVHTLFEIMGPGHLNVESVAHLQLILVFALILSSLSDLVLTECAVIALLDSFLFILDRSIKRFNSLLPLHVVTINVDHQVIESIL
jgi:hypothetical protein